MLLAVGLGLTACSGTHEARKEHLSAVAKPVVKAEFDVPTLVGLSIEELTARLGPPQALPATFHDPVTMPLEQRGILNDSSVLFRAASLPIIAAFDLENGQVTDLVVLGNDEEQLMQQANLMLNARDYIIMSVFQERSPTKFMGMRVIGRTLR